MKINSDEQQAIFARQVQSVLRLMVGFKDIYEEKKTNKMQQLDVYY